MSTSPKLRRSARLISKDMKSAPETNLATSSFQVPSDSGGSKGCGKSKVHAKSNTTKTTKTIESRRRQVELEIALRKKNLEQEMLELEYRKKQEKLDLELALRLAEIDVNDESESSVSYERSNAGPDIENWVDGKDPWQVQSVSENQQRQMPERVKKEAYQVKRSFSSFSHHFPSVNVANECPNQISPNQLTKFLTRQSMPKDLPVFSGNPIEWPNFIYQYRNSTDICGYSQEENHCRLQNSLKGNARKIVQSLLIMPQNVDKIIQILENRFGQSEQIIMLLLDQLKAFPIVKEDKLDCLINFSDEVKNLVGTIESLDAQDHLQNPILLHKLLKKLPNSYQMMWVEHISNITSPTHKLVEFASWLDKKAMIACKIQIPKYHDDSDTKKSKSFHKKEMTLTTMIKKTCICCKNEMHALTGCPKFKSLSVDQRWELVTKNKICFACLIPYHNIYVCKKKKMCGINNCKKNHHILLHKKEDEHISVEASSSGNDDKNELDVHINCHISTNKHVLLKILPIIICSNQKSIKTYALLDDASTVTLIDQDLADTLSIDGPQQPLCLQWTNNQTKKQDDSRTVSFTVRSENGSGEFQLRHVRTMKGMSLPTQTVDVGEICKNYPFIDNRGISMINAKPKVLIGQDNWPLLVNRKIITGPWNGPALSKTLLGWVIHGNILETKDDHKNKIGFVCYVNSKEKDDLDLLHDLVKEQWKLDCFGLDKIDKAMSKEDIRAQNILDKTMKRIGNRFETGLLWRDENIILPDSKNNAMKRLLCTEKKIDSNPQYGKAYCDKMLELQNKNYIRKLSVEEADQYSPKTWYLPHFGIINPNKPTKLRIVFDAASKCNGVSLNDFLLTGPDLYNDLQTILLNFRIKAFAFVADIREMFLQVRVRKEDCASQRILWRGMDRHRDPDVYEIGVVFFGSTNGPCLVQEAKNRNAREFQAEYPEAAKSIIEEHYMDDFLGNADSIDEGKKLINDVIHVHSMAGFVICNWISNSDKLLEGIASDLKAQSDKKLETNPEGVAERVLGVFWNSTEDSFLFRTKFQKIDPSVSENKRRPTKREILKVVMSIFAPIGFLANFIIQGKILLQDIWRSQLGWDDEITDILNEKWRSWLFDLKNLSNLKIPRQYFTIDRNDCEIQLHIFCDASEKSYATLVYLRCQGNNDIQTAFVSAKARVSSLKHISIPRLELQAALIGARLGNYLKNNLKLNFQKIFYWSDSKTVLHWICSEARRFAIFVAHRVGEIQHLTNASEWRYVPSKENVADEATKRHNGLDFSNNSRWLRGPKFLRMSIDYWPKNKEDLEINDELDLELRKEFVFLNFEKRVLPTPDPERFSKWCRLVRATGWMLRFIKNCKNKKLQIRTLDRSLQNFVELDSDEISVAENLLFRKSQQDTFYREIETLKQNRPIDKASRLYTLSCSIDDISGLLRLNGRLDNLIGVSRDFKQPIILDPDHKISRLLIQHYHDEVRHHGQETVINNLRQKFWILRMRQAVKSSWSRCQKCKNRKYLPEIPIMGQLPPCRLEPTVRPFVKTGIDYFGPILITVKRSHEKRYGVIFTCMVTRAVHLEIAHDLSTNGFIHALRQFGCRRGFPSEIYCDNGTQFKVAEKELADCIKSLSETEITQFCSLKNIKFRWNPPGCPHMGGIWKRLIQSIKKVMYELLKSRYPPEYVLRTVFAEVENIINSRPLTHVSLDSDDSEALTPNHFLIGPDYTALPCSQTEESDLNLLSKWKAAQKLTDLFWKRWTREYMPFLIKRTRWYTESRAIKENDVVIIMDPNGPRNMWPKGRVIQLHTARDGRVRVVDVQLANGTVFRRPVSRLCVLNVQ